VVPDTFVHFGLQPVRYPLIKPQYISTIRRASCVIACVGFGTRLERENLDRSYHLPAMQGQYLSDVAALNPHTVVVLNAGAGVGMEPWIHKVPALLDAWYPGENGNRAIADILTGKIDPSGRLPDTFSKHWRDEPAYGHYPGHHLQVTFAEGIFTGYRWFDHKHIAPLFPFGFGLSYTRFSFSPLTITSDGTGRHRIITVRVSIADIGRRSGAEVAQLYIRPQHSKVLRCFQSLKGFGRVNLAPGQTGVVTMRLDWRDFAYFSTQKNAWVVPHGLYEIAVGSNSRDIKSTGMVRW
jgi:beta-glucosidase